MAVINGLIVVCYSWHDDSGANDIKTKLQTNPPAILDDNTSYSYWGGNGGHGGSNNCIPSEYQSYGTKVFGYLTGDYEDTEREDGSGDLDNNLSKIHSIATVDGADGVFFDEVSNNPNAAAKSYLQDIYDQCQTDGIEVIFNTGTDSFDYAWLKDRSDYLMSDELYEDERSPTASETGYGVGNIMVITYNESTAADGAANSNSAWDEGFGYTWAVDNILYPFPQGWEGGYESYVALLDPPAGVVAPTVTTQECTSVETTSATGNGNITDTGGENCTRRGFCYLEGNSGDPDTDDSTAYDDGSFGTGAYTKSITGLTAATDYRVRAYAVNSEGTSYGDTVDLTTDAITETSYPAPVGGKGTWGWEACDYGASEETARGTKNSWAWDAPVASGGSKIRQGTKNSWTWEDE